MPRQKPKTELATLQKHHSDLATKLRAAKSKVKAEAKQNERLKCELVGAVALKEFAANPSSPFAATLRNLIGAGVTNATIRAELGFPALPKRAKAAAAVPAEVKAISGGDIRPPAPTPAPAPPLPPPAPPATAVNPFGSMLRNLGIGGGKPHPTGQT